MDELHFDVPAGQLLRDDLAYDDPYHCKSACAVEMLGLQLQSDLFLDALRHTV